MAGGSAPPRLASPEVIATALHVPDGSRAYCIVTSHGQGRDGPRILVVAGAVIDALPARDHPRDTARSAVD